MNIREEIEQSELSGYSPYAAKAALSKGRLRPEADCAIRSCFMRDKDRILYSNAFRRLKHKTQVFLQPEGDHYRTRMTHTLEVAAIARTIARALRLNTDLVEAVALGHDLGHTPFGHAGELALCQVFEPGFKHNEQSLRVVDLLEKDGQGLNLTYEVRMGILNHTGSGCPETLEGKVVRLSDRVAYINHDIDDAIRGGILQKEDIPEDIRETLGDTHSKRVDTLVRDIIEQSRDREDISMTPAVYDSMMKLREFMFDNVYKNPTAKGEESKARGILISLYEYYLKSPEKLNGHYLARAEEEGISRVICDYIAGMSDKYAVSMYYEAFIPKTWQVYG